MEARTHAAGLEHRRGNKGKKPRDGASGTEQSGKVATSIQGTIQGTAGRRRGPDVYGGLYPSP